MPAAFLHGVETIDVPSGTKKVRGVKSSVIGLVGTAPIHHLAVADQLKNQNVLSVNDVEDALKAGPDLGGYTIPSALATLRAEGAQWVILVNVFDPATHKTTVAAADLLITDTDEIQLAVPDIISLVVKVTGGGGSALVVGTDYSIDKVTGLITFLEGGALEGDAGANVAYVHGDPSAVDDADIIGTVDGGGNRTGAQKWLDAKSSMGFGPKILIAPGYSSLATVVSALQTLAQRDKLRAVVPFDAPAGTTVAEAIEGRGPDGEINFNVADRRLIPLFPHVIRGGATKPYSPSYAGMMAYTDQTLGFWKSPSNKTLKSIQGLEVSITASVNDATSEANQLNEVGIVTVFNAFGTGFRAWGNRSSIFPSESGLETFIKMIRIADQIHESIEMAMIQFFDDDLNDVLVKQVLDATNAYMRTLITRKAIPQGSRVEFQEAKNPAEELAEGHATFTQVFAGFAPLERTTFESIIDTSLLAIAGT